MALSKIQRSALVAVILAMSAIVAVTPKFGIVPILIALLCLMPLGTSLSRAGRLAESLRGFQHRPIEIHVWGELLPQIGDSTCEIDSIKALGAGLHLFVTCGGDHATDLKIAQPRNAQISGDAAEIRDAAYVQWAGIGAKRTARTDSPISISGVMICDR